MDANVATGFCRTFVMKTNSIESRYQLKSLSLVIGPVILTGRVPRTKVIWTAMYCRQTWRRAKRMYVAAYRGNGEPLTTGMAVRRCAPLLLRIFQRPFFLFTRRYLVPCPVASSRPSNPLSFLFLDVHTFLLNY